MDPFVIRCCCVGWDSRGCNRAMGAKDTHVRSHKSNTDIEDANNLILLTDSALCQKKGTEHRVHRSFPTHMPVTSSWEGE